VARAQHAARASRVGDRLRTPESARRATSGDAITVTAAIAEAVFERIDVLGVTDYTFTLTAQAKARGWDAAFGGAIVRVKEGRSGRGERASASLTQQSLRFVMINCTPRESLTAATARSA
jgi:hypothetical protein